jgi:hypothetical protein
MSPANSAAKHPAAEHTDYQCPQQQSLLQQREALEDDYGSVLTIWRLR